MSRYFEEDKNKILLIIAFGWALSFGVRLAYPVLLPYLQTSYGLTFTTAGSLLTILWFTYAIGQLPAGFLADRIGEQAIMTGSMFVSAAMLLLIVISEVTPVLFLATALFGVGNALFGVVRLSAVSDIYPEKLGTAIGLVSAAGDAGNTVLPLIASFLAAVFAWQLGFAFVAPLFVVTGVVMWLVVPERTSSSRSAENILSFENLRNVFATLRRPSILIILLIQIFFSAIWQAFTGFYPIYLIEMKGLSPAISSTLFALYFALGIVIKPLSGNVYDRVGPRVSLLVLTGASTIAIGVIPLLNNLYMLVIATIIVSTLGGKSIITLSYMTEILPDDMLNTGLGTLRAVYMMIASFSPVAFGLLADRGFFNESFYLLAGMSLVTIFCILLLPDR